MALRAYRLLLLFGVLTLIGSAATLLLQGGWESAAAGFAMLNGVGFALTFAVIGAASERPRPLQPGWTQTADGPRRAAAEPAPVAVEPAPPRPVEGSPRASAPARPAHPSAAA